MIRSALNGCDLYLFPTLEETEGIPIIEACACKTNAIIRDIPIFEGKLKNVTDNYQEVVDQKDLRNIGKQLKEVYEEVLKD